MTPRASRHLIALFLAGLLAACADAAGGAVTLRVFAAAGPDPLDSAVTLRLGLVGGASVILPRDSAFDLDAIGLQGAAGTHQVYLEALDAAGQVVARGVSRPEFLGGDSATFIDLVLRRIGAFSAGLGPVEVGDAYPRIASGASLGDGALLSGREGLFLVDTWLVSTAAVLGDSARAELGGLLASGPLLLHDDDDMDRIVLANAAGCAALKRDRGVYATDIAPVCTGTETIRSDASVLALRGSGWWVVGGQAAPGGGGDCAFVTYAPCGDGCSAEVVVSPCADLATPRSRPIVVAAGGRVAIVGGTTAGAWGELRPLHNPAAGIETLVDGPARPPTDGATYGADSAVFVGDGTPNIYALVDGVLGVAGTLGRTRAGAAVAVLPDGRLIVAGGRAEDSATSAELLRQNSSGQFEFISEVLLLVPRSDAHFAAAPQGPVLVGGVAFGTTEPVSVIEAYLPP